ncbi:uncharacterized protein LOC134466070 [Engraulis encrasicolus]|uniref:uncharacterized protein LOC134466070 n=1 Tax=Engraulis encrasicolus TaxID=184585 RepID=UPI002FD7937B
MEETSRATALASVPGSEGSEVATGSSTPETETPNVAVRDLDVAMHGLNQHALSDSQTLSVQETITVTEQDTCITTTPSQEDQQLGSDDVTAVSVFSAVTGTEMVDLGVAVLPTEAPSEQSLPPSYSIIFDNLDFFSRTHHQSISRTNQSIHWIHHIAVEDRVLGTHLSTQKPNRLLSDYDIGNSLPSPDTQALIRREYIVLGSRILTTYLDSFKPLSSVVVHHIPHKYSAEMAEPSTHYLLGLLFKDENKSTELVEVLQHIQKEYVPVGPDGPQTILVGGDRLTEGNCRNLQWAFAEGERNCG